ncbi:hypothetical protein ACFO4E_15645 [Nocardiopsis mangrovi]|uniref:Uncharacterized protein n=1 Tax=Nocardiopsis mangrovi TaxID=1179818 RepID=A0ABV9DWN1_9ACTN
MDHRRRPLPCHNTSAIGVCVIGTYSRTLPSPAALAAVAALYTEAGNRTDRDLTIMGDRDGFSTSCPGDAPLRLGGRRHAHHLTHRRR